MDALKMKIYGLIGYPLSHSFSQKYFTEKFRKENITDCEFKNFPLESINNFPALLAQHPNLRGISVTIPHKQNVIKFLKNIDQTANEIGAVNCIRVNDMKGFNTDIIGFEQSIKPLLKEHHTHALVLGTGGASKAVTYILDKLKIKFKYVSRYKHSITPSAYYEKISDKSDDYLKKIITYSDIDSNCLQKYNLIINTTPVGMYPNIHEYPNIPYEFLTDKHFLYDLVYNPEETLFIKKGKERGAQTKNGLEMLYLQAEKAWQIWNS